MADIKVGKDGARVVLTGVGGEPVSGYFAMPRDPWTNAKVILTPLQQPTYDGARTRATFIEIAAMPAALLVPDGAVAPGAVAFSRSVRVQESVPDIMNVFHRAKLQMHGPQIRPQGPFSKGVNRLRLALGA